MQTNPVSTMPPRGLLWVVGPNLCHTPGRVRCLPLVLLGIWDSKPLGYLQALVSLERLFAKFRIHEDLQRLRTIRTVPYRLLILPESIPRQRLHDSSLDMSQTLEIQQELHRHCQRSSGQTFQFFVTESVQG